MFFNFKTSFLLAVSIYILIGRKCKNWKKKKRAASDEGHSLCGWYSNIVIILIENNHFAFLNIA